MVRQVEQDVTPRLDTAGASEVKSPVQGSNDSSLSVLLRHGCAAEHRALEDMIGIRGTDMALGDYVSLLMMFRALHSASDGWRNKFAEACDRHSVPRENPGLVDLIDHDLKTLGVHLIPTRNALFAIDQDMGFPMVLGALYVVAGSALGNVLMLRQIHSSPDSACARATTFLSASACNAGPTFQILRLCLDDFGVRTPRAQDAVVEGARRTFRACATTFRSL